MTDALFDECNELNNKTFTEYTIIAKTNYLIKHGAIFGYNNDTNVCTLKIVDNCNTVCTFTYDGVEEFKDIINTAINILEDK